MGMYSQHTMHSPHCLSETREKYWFRTDTSAGMLKLS
jgi:hypothetical protein